MMKWRLRLLKIAVLASAVGAITALASLGVPSRSPLPISIDEAHAAFIAIQLTVIAPDGPMGTHEICDRWADDTTLCLQSIEEHGNRAPVTEVQSIATSTLADGTARVDVVGLDRDGQTFHSALQMVRSGDRVKAVDPVYWFDRELVDLTGTTAFD